jgi:alcohol dehydrogenase class IV
MLKSFSFVAAEQIQFGENSIYSLGEVCETSGLTHVLVACDAFFRENPSVLKALNGLEEHNVKYSMFTEFSPSPTFSEAEKAGEFMKKNGCDGCVAIGGGSSMDLAKAAALLGTNPPPITKYLGTGNVKKRALPVICVTTTSGTGSEVTTVSVLKDDKTHVKSAICSNWIRPIYAIVDPVLTYSMPPGLTAATGFDALAHAVEGYNSTRASVITHLYHTKSIELIGKWLPAAVCDGRNEEARYNMSLASMMAALGENNSSASLNHAMAYPIEAKYSVHHGVANGTLLPWTTRYNAISNLERSRNVAILLGENIDGLSDFDAAMKGVDCLIRMARNISIPTLTEIGVAENDLEPFAEITINNTRLLAPNPRIPTKEDIIGIYKAAM